MRSAPRGSEVAELTRPGNEFFGSEMLAGLDAQRLRLFWTFIAMRQEIWFRRFCLRLPPPWTEDSTLASYHFTNVYRELDPGTQYSLEQILEQDEPAPDRIFNIMIYRLIGKEVSHESLGFQHLREFDPENASTRLHNLRKEGEPPFTAAYVVSGYHGQGGQDKIENVCILFTRLRANFEKFYSDLMRASTASNACDVISSQDGFGSFLSFQILVDLTYPLSREGGRPILPFSQNDWARAGPGARKGIAVLTDGRGVDELELMQSLRLAQESEFERLGLEFHFLRNARNQIVPISLPNIQNCLCEFYKYVKIREGWGRARRRFESVERAQPRVRIEDFTSFMRR